MNMAVPLAILAAAFCTAEVAADPETPAGLTSPYYEVVGGSVDGRTFDGWHLYHQTCVSCHGADGAGTEQAPDLTRAVARFTPDEFQVRVLQRYLIDVSPETGIEASGGLRELLLEEVRKSEARDPAQMDMPAWVHNPIIRERIMSLYSYLKARSDGVLAPGHPDVISDDPPAP